MSKRELEIFFKHTLPVVFSLAMFDAVCIAVAIMGSHAEVSIAVGAIMIIVNVIVIVMVE